MWLVQPGRKLMSDQLFACPHCSANKEADLLFGEPRYDPDAIVKPEALRQLVQAVADVGDRADSERDVKVAFVGCDNDKTAPQSADCLPEAAKQVGQTPADAAAAVKDGHAEMSIGEDATIDVVEDSTPNAVPLGLLERCQGLWYSEDGQKIGSIEGNQVVWCEHTFDGDPCKLIATSDARLTMELDGETHSADVHEGPPEKIVWSDGELWLRS